MRTLTALLILFLIVNESFGQIRYEKGYFINRANVRTECLIRNRDWKNNPTEFRYKLEDSNIVENGNINSIKEFGIYNFSKFVSADVKIDRSKLQATELIGNENPLWRQEQLFLKVLLEGKANLYCFDDSNGRRFFYSVKDTAISQLVYKKFRVNFLAKNTFGEQLSPIAENNTYKDQLLLDLNCPDATLESVEDVTYRTDDLEKYFRSYNQCMGDTIIEKKKKSKKSYFNLKIAPGINSSTVSMPISVESPFPAFEFKRSEGFRIGLEFESLLPFNRNKWALVFEPTFQSFNAKAENGVTNIAFKSLEFPVGLRYYFYLNDYTRLFVNGFYISNFAMNFHSKIELYPTVGLGIGPSSNAAFGGGIEHKRLSFEARYYTGRNLLRNFANLDAYYSRFSIIVGYKIIRGKH